MTPFAMSEYRRQRKLGWPARHALSHARTWDRFANLENAGLVKLEAECDESPDLSYLDQDCFAKERDREYARANSEGMTGIVGYARVSEDDEWESVDSVWGFIGDDWRNSGHDSDIMFACVQWHDERSTAVAQAMEAERPDMYAD